jgi:hypothetical protein
MLIFDAEAFISKCHTRNDTLILAIATAADEIENSVAIKKAREVDKGLARAQCYKTFCVRNL